MTTFSQNGNEVAWGTIGNASTAEGMFWESINAIGVLRGPMVLSIWDDGLNCIAWAIHHANVHPGKIFTHDAQGEKLNA